MPVEVSTPRQRRLKISGFLTVVGISLFFATIVISFFDQVTAFYVIGWVGIVSLLGSIAFLVNRK